MVDFGKMLSWSKIAKLAGMLGSEHDGERLNAARLLQSELKKAGLNFADLADRLKKESDGAPRVEYVTRYEYRDRERERNPAVQMANKILEMGGSKITTREREFLLSVLQRDELTRGRYTLTNGQAEWLVNLEVQYCRPKPTVRKTKPPGPIPESIIDELFGEPSREAKPRDKMPDATNEENQTDSGVSVEDFLDNMGLGRAQGNYRGARPESAANERFKGGLDIEDEPPW